MLISKDTPKRVALELGKMNCVDKKCVHCCKFGSGYVLRDEIPKIAESLKMTPEELEKNYLEPAEKFNTRHMKFKTRNEKGKPYGPCVFLNEQAGCLIHDVKPLNCRIGNCGMNGSDLQKWFDLNFFVNADDPESIRQYAVYLEFNEPLPGGRLKELVSNPTRLQRILNYDIIR
jgi:Fe-S-cluster containining protein